MPGIDVLFVGPSDLSYSMGMFREFDHPAFRDAIVRVNEAARAAGKATGIFLTAVEQVPAALADGFRMIALGSDGGYMMAAAKETLARARDQRAGVSAARIASAHRSPSGHSSSRTSGSALRSSSRIQSASSRDSTNCVSASRQAFRRLGRMTIVRMPS